MHYSIPKPQSPSTGVPCHSSTWWELCVMITCQSNLVTKEFEYNRMPLVLPSLIKSNSYLLCVLWLLFNISYYPWYGKQKMVGLLSVSATVRIFVIFKYRLCHEKKIHLDYYTQVCIHVKACYLLPKWTLFHSNSLM